MINGCLLTAAHCPYGHSTGHVIDPVTGKEIPLDFSTIQVRDPNAKYDKKIIKSDQIANDMAVIRLHGNYTHPQSESVLATKDVETCSQESFLAACKDCRKDCGQLAFAVGYDLEHKRRVGAVNLGGYREELIGQKKAGTLTSLPAPGYVEPGWSGGPLFSVGANGEPVVVGINSTSADTQAGPLEPYTVKQTHSHASVPFHLDWISKTLKKLGCSDEVQSPEETARRKELADEKAKTKKEDQIQARTKKFERFRDYYQNLDAQGFIRATTDYLTKSDDGPKFNMQAATTEMVGFSKVKPDDRGKIFPGTE